jgi:hypothetical protein
MCLAYRRQNSITSARPEGFQVNNTSIDPVSFWHESSKQRSEQCGGMAFCAFLIFPSQMFAHPDDSAIS